MAAYRDPELAFLRVGESWCAIRRMLQGSTEQRQAAKEQAQQVLFPFLDMLGMRAPRAELEEQLDNADRHDRNLTEPLDQAAATVIAQLKARLPDVTLHYNKYTQTHNFLASDDRQAIRSAHAVPIAILVADVETCYQALYQVQQLYTPVEGGLADLLHSPRINGYCALHAAVVAQLSTGKVRINFAIVPRTQHEINQWGLAALYMRNRLPVTAPNAWWNHAESGYAQIAVAAPGELPEHLYVFSPHGQLFGFDRGSTVVDFAYYVHSDLAEQCRRFVVNGRPVEPSTVLHHLDLIELEHDPRAPGPSRGWLQAAQTARARSAIERFLKRQGRGSHHGQKIIDERLKVLEQHYGFNLPADLIEKSIQDCLRREKMSRREDLLTAIAAGQFAADRLFHRLFEREVLRQVEIPRSTSLRHHQLHLAQCCRPRPGDNIVGRLYRRHGEIVNMTVHAEACPQIATHPETTPLKWRLQPVLAAFARIDLHAQDEPGLLGTAIAEIYARQPRVTLHQVHATARHGSARIQFDVQADQPATVQEIVGALQRLADYSIGDVISLNLPPSEQQRWLDLAAGKIFNPYSRLPVYEDTMFFGRTQERLRVLECLRSRQPSVWLIGQKRLGKTSLLLHLKEHELPAHQFTPVFIDFQLIGNPARTDVFYEVANTVHSSLVVDARLLEMGAPLRTLFEENPARQLIDYLTGVQDLLGSRRLILLMDEFSRLTDAYLQGQIDGAFFDRWRAMMHTTQRSGIGYVVVMQQQTRDTLMRHLQKMPDDPSWRLMDVGQQIQLRPLRDDDVRRLIEWPMRNHLEYEAAVVDRIASLTGGSPFLIQAFCHSLVMHMARHQRQQITMTDLDLVRMEFLQPQDHTFAHMTELVRGISNHVAGTIARLASMQTDGQVTWSKVRAALPNLGEENLRVSLHTLMGQDVLQQPEPDRWQFSSLLFQQWLALNAQWESEQEDAAWTQIVNRSSDVTESSSRSAMVCSHHSPKVSLLWGQS